jgi:hypothetical protein
MTLAMFLASDEEVVDIVAGVIEGNLNGANPDWARICARAALGVMGVPFLLGEIRRLRGLLAEFEEERDGDVAGL